jgi:hypothetical protein
LLCKLETFLIGWSEGFGIWIVLENVLIQTEVNLGYSCITLEDASEVKRKDYGKYQMDHK